MINSMQKALIKKDLVAITANKQLLSVILIVPLVLTIVVPSIFILAIQFAPSDTSDFEQMLKLLPRKEQTGDVNQTIIKLLLNNIMPMFFLLIPIMASSVMAASSFVGEKEKHTLETLLYCPLSLKQIFQSKILASFSMSMIVSFISFAAMIFVVEAEVLLITGIPVLPDVSWLLIMLLIAPALSLIAITLIVRGSAKAKTMEEAQQRSVFLILPIILVVVGQFSGVILISVWLVLGLGIILAAVAMFLMRGVAGRFNYETLLR